MLRVLDLIELQRLDLQSGRVVNLAGLEALVDRFLQVPVILDRLVQVWHRALEHVFDDSLDEDVLFSSELGVVEVSDRFQNDVLFKLFLLVVLVWVDSDLSVDCSWLSLGELGVTPQPVVQLTSAFIVLFFIIFWE